MKFTVLVHEAEEGGYWAECIELPGAVSSGESLDELDRNIRDAIQSILEVRAEAGGVITTPAPAEEQLTDSSVRTWRIFVPLPVAA